MVNRIIIGHVFLEGAAITNRTIGFAKGYRMYGKEVHLLLYTTQAKPDLTIEGVNIVCVPELGIPVKFLRRILSGIRFVREIKKRYIHGSSAIHIRSTPWWGILFNRRKYDFFFERGEIPFFVDNGSLIFKLTEHIGNIESKRATGMLVQTEAIREYYLKHGVKNAEVINMFVDQDRFSVPMKAEGTRYIAYCGIICKNKDGVDDLIKAFAIVHKENPDYKLYLIGGFEPFYGDEEYLRGLIDSSGLTESIVITGKLKPEQIPELLCGASILALSRPRNRQTMGGFPTKLGEYLCTGKPVVLTPVGEIGNYLQDKVNCIFAEPGNYEDFAEKLLWVVNNYDEAMKIGAAGKALVDTVFSIPIESRKALSFIERVAKGV